MKKKIDPENYVLLTGSSNPDLAQSIAKFLKKGLFNPVSRFADGEIRVKVPENVRRRHVYIIQPTCPPVNTSVMELILMIDAIKRSSADEITAIIPYFGYSRQDRKEMPRVPISASVVANILTNAGADRILTLDIHSEQAQGFIKQAWDNLYGSYALIPELKKRKLKHAVAASPDKGGLHRATVYARLLGIKDIALVYKERDIKLNDTSKAMAMIGDVDGRDVLLVDDMIASGGTIVHAAEYLKQRGAKRVIVCTTHGLFSGDALQIIQKSSIDEVIATDTIPAQEKERGVTKISRVSIAPLLARAILKLESGESISKELILNT